jgi:hypothetical protein
MLSAGDIKELAQEYATFMREHCTRTAYWEDVHGMRGSSSVDVEIMRLLGWELRRESVWSINSKVNNQGYLCERSE